MDLPSFIRAQADDVGDAIAKAAELFDESPRAVKGWLYRERLPRPDRAEKIVRATKGKVSFASIYGEPQQ